MIVEYSVGQFLAWLIRAHYLIIHRQFGTLTANLGFPWKRMEKLIRAVRGVESVTFWQLSPSWPLLRGSCQIWYFQVVFVDSPRSYVRAGCVIRGWGKRWLAIMVFWYVLNTLLTILVGAGCDVRATNPLPRCGSGAPFLLSPAL